MQEATGLVGSRDLIRIHGDDDVLLGNGSTNTIIDEGFVGQDIGAFVHIAMQSRNVPVIVVREREQQGGVAVFHVEVDATGVLEQEAAEAALDALQRARMGEATAGVAGALACIGTALVLDTEAAKAVVAGIGCDAVAYGAQKTAVVEDLAGSFAVKGALNAATLKHEVRVVERIDEPLELHGVELEKHVEAVDAQCLLVLDAPV